VTLRVELVTPEGEIWTGNARMVIAKTLEGNLGVLTGHPPVLGILAEGSLVWILDPESGAGDGEAPSGASTILAAVSSGFLSVADDRVSVLARAAQLGARVDTAAAKASLEAAEAEAEPLAAGEQEPAEVKYARALLRAASGEQP
jgi:F-type H+-transporting ATPase subunit epsilon